MSYEGIQDSRLYFSWTKVRLAGHQTKALFWSYRGRLHIETSFVALANQPPDAVSTSIIEENGL